MPGCWLATQPDRGSDVVDMDAAVGGECKQVKATWWRARTVSEYVISGQSSAWVSYAPLAQTAMAYLPCDYGEGFYPRDEQGSASCGYS